MSNARMTLTVQASESWLPFIEDAARRYAKTFKFQQALEDAVVLSVLEACEQLLIKVKEANIRSEYSVLFDLQNDAIVIEISYNGKIPLNPHLTEDYEVRGGTQDLGGFDLSQCDSLWLHLIKKLMDRVSFHVRGNLHVLKMVKYRRNEGEELRLWALSLSPALKDGLHKEWIYSDGECRGCLLQDLESKKVIRLGSTEASAVKKIDGQTSLYEIYLDCVAERGPFAPQLMVTLFEALEAAGMLADPNADRPIGRFRAVLNKILNPVFSIPRADSFVEAIYRMARPLFGPVGLALCLLLGFSGLIPLIEYHPEHKMSLTDLEMDILAQPWILVALYFLTMVMVVIHELGHALVCKHYGGTVPRIGVMFYLASFIFFCDTTSSWSFPKKSQRIMVSLGGPLTTFALLGVGLWFAGYYVKTESFWEPVWLLFCVTCFLGLIMNFNPFIRMDAYYMLMDWTGIPNLRERSFKYLEHLLLGRFMQHTVSEKIEPNPRERRILALYGLIGSLMTVFLFVVPIVYYCQLLWKESVHQGRLIFGVVVVVIALLRLSHSAYKKLQSLRYRDYKLA